MNPAPKILRVSPEWENRRTKIQELLNKSKRSNYLVYIVRKTYEAEVFEPNPNKLSRQLNTWWERGDIEYPWKKRRQAATPSNLTRTRSAVVDGSVPRPADKVGNQTSYNTIQGTIVAPLANATDGSTSDREFSVENDNSIYGHDAVFPFDFNALSTYALDALPLFDLPKVDARNSFSSVP
ncbi:hypothetical protein V500_03775 [Pseudogymnoascus sp. VKM F-4518 (FW-2643)]|nr:hypothetical protein V500_03775 [Pseudogymnoascus sp. VKM F-4518 (FW-2643)]